MLRITTLLALLFFVATLNACASRTMLVRPLERAAPQMTALPEGPALSAYLERLREWSEAEAAHDRSDGIDSIIVTVTKRAQEASITNNQVAGVDEGDIVKRMGDWIVLLRRGRIFVLDVGSHPGTPIRKLGQADCAPAGSQHDAWYDELLVFDRTVVLIGYSYETERTELSLFDVDAAGAIVHRETFLLPSFDYFSGNNYATRKVGDRLLFYMPIPLLDRNMVDPETGRITLRIARLSDRSTQTLIESLELYSPLQHSLDPVAHTVLDCPLAASSLSCSARAVLGPGWSEMFVSQTAVYLWIEGGEGWALDPIAVDGGRYAAALESGALDRWAALDDGVLYRFPLGGGAPGAIALGAAPIDAFSFRERGDRLQLVLASLDEDSIGWTEIPLAAFTMELARWPDGFIRQVTRWNGDFDVLNRFVGDFLVVRTYDSPDVFDVVVQPTEEAGGPHHIALDFLPTRIEDVDSEAVIVGHRYTGDWYPVSLDVVSVALGMPSQPGGSTSFGNRAESESRSHGFNFGRTADGWLLGVPSVRFEDGVYPWDDDDPVPGEITFLELGSDLGLRPVGELRQTEEDLRRDDGCKVSCTDWYGSARPFFFDGRIFALMDYDLIEAQLTAGEIQELQRRSALDP